MLSLLKYVFEQKAEMKSTQAQRVLLLYRYILDSGILTVAQAGQYLLSKGLDGISVRTLQRDLNMILTVMDDICKKSGVGIEGVLYLCDSNENEKIDIDQTNSIDSKDTSQPEVLKATTKSILEKKVTIDDTTTELSGVESIRVDDLGSDDKLSTDSENQSTVKTNSNSDIKTSKSKSEGKKSGKSEKSEKKVDATKDDPDSKDNTKPDKADEKTKADLTAKKNTKKTTKSRLPAGFNKIDKYELQAQKYLKKYSRAKSKNDYQEEVTEFLSRNSYDDKSVKISRKGMVTIYLKKLKAKQVIKLMKELQDKLTFE
jgi:hypothetical protein